MSIHYCYIRVTLQPVIHGLNFLDLLYREWNDDELDELFEGVLQDMKTVCTNYLEVIRDGALKVRDNLHRCTCTLT